VIAPGFVDTSSLKLRPIGRCYMSPKLILHMRSALPLRT